MRWSAIRRHFTATLPTCFFVRPPSFLDVCRLIIRFCVQMPCEAAKALHVSEVMTVPRCWLARFLSFVAIACLSRAQGPLLPDSIDCSVFLRDGSNVYVDSSLFNQSAGPFLLNQAIKEKTSTDAIRVGNETIIVCLFESAAVLNVSWSKDDSKDSINSTKCADGKNGVYSTQNVTAKQINATLVICKAQEKDAAIYVLSLNFPSGAKTEKPVQIFAEAYITNKKDFKSQSVYEGNSVTFVCKTAGVPPPMIYWFFDDARLSNGSHADRITLSSDSSSLKLTNAKSSDRGHYKCLVNNTRANGQLITSNYSTLLLRVRDPLGALWPVVGIVAQAIVLFIIIYADGKARSQKPTGFVRLGSGRGSSVRSTQSEDYEDDPAVSVIPGSGSARFLKQQDGKSNHGGAEPLMNDKEAMENINLHSVSV